MFHFGKPRFIFFKYLPIFLISTALLGVSCSNTIHPVSQSGTTSIGTVVEDGIVSESTSSNFTLLTTVGRLVLRFDSNTVSESNDLNSGKTVTGPVNANDLYQGVELSVEYYKANNLAVKIVFRTYDRYTLVSGAINQATSSNITLRAVLNGADRTLFITFDPSSIIIIKKDGSPGNAGDLVAGMNIEAYCGEGSTNAAVIVIH
jgi:hypothetical protein